MARRGWRSAVLAAAAFAATAAASAGMAAAVVNVSQKHREFTPGRVIVARGGTVRIVNDDDVTHHVFIDTPQMSFDSGEQPIGTSVDLHFTRVGTFPVQCAIHPTMHLEVVVQ